MTMMMDGRTACQSVSSKQKISSAVVNVKEKKSNVCV